MIGSIQHRPDRPNRPYRARYWDNGKQVSKSFRRKYHARLWLWNQTDIQEQERAKRLT